LKVLIADDSALLRERIGDLICEIEGIELIGQAGDAQTAMEAIRQLRPHVAILDIRMPKGNGIRVLAQAKQAPSPPIVIMLTAFPYPQYREKCLEAGADYFFDKTTEFGCLVGLLEKLRDEMQADASRGSGRPLEPLRTPGN
jgi:DNA-binding NarL/FixJ family response regulator